ncbi:MAG: GIY-YIG nuclease family protein [Candidatus Brocadia sp.]
MDFASNTGVYCLVVQLLQRSHIRIGCLGTFHFPAGFYVYVGSAQGNLKRRIERHLRQKKRIHWHIDYLLRHGQIVSVYTYAGKKDKECMLSHKIGNIKNAVVPVKGFGSSDCSCHSHLYFFPDEPDPEIFARFSKS